jgi:outer membrane protein assembly factor BamD (BamD/ComL family)
LQATAKAISVAGPEYRRINLRTADPDSLRSVLAELYMEMGWQMYDQIVNIDSARYYYQKALDNHLADSLRPQAVYTMAAIERKAGNEAEAIALEDRLIRDYPYSRYAHGLMAQRGIPLPKDSTALAQEAYDRAALLIERGDRQAGIEMMQGVIRDFPETPPALRAQLAIAMIYEDDRGDEALAMYKDMVENHPESPYSQRGKDILAAIDGYEKDAVRRQQEAEARAEAEAKAEEERKRKEMRMRNPLLDEELKVMRDSVRAKEPKIDPSRDSDFPLRLPGDEPERDTTSVTPMNPPATPTNPRDRRPGGAPPTTMPAGDTIRRLSPTTPIEK